jgi:cytochrome o ubiquinol oxidase subunit IV
MEHDLTLKEIQKEYHGTLKAYLIGFIGSIVLTCISFLLVITRAFSDQNLIYAVVSLALVQAIGQLLFFLHLGQEAKPRWETVVFCFMVVVLLIIAIGSLWIMSDLNTRVMSGMN